MQFIRYMGASLMNSTTLIQKIKVTDFTYGVETNKNFPALKDED